MYRRGRRGIGEGEGERGEREEGGNGERGREIVTWLSVHHVLALVFV